MERYVGEYGENAESIRQATEAAQLRDIMHLVMHAFPVINAAEQSMEPYFQLFQNAYQHHQALVGSLVERHSYIPTLIVQDAMAISDQRLDAQMRDDLEQIGLWALVDHIQNFDPRTMEAGSKQGNNFKIKAHTRVAYEMAKAYSHEIGVTLKRRSLNELVQLKGSRIENYGLEVPQEETSSLDLDPEMLLKEDLEQIVAGNTYVPLTPHEREVMKGIYSGSMGEISRLHTNARVKIREALQR